MHGFKVNQIISYGKEVMIKKKNISVPFIDKSTGSPLWLKDISLNILD
jgi:hypothetical protein